MKRRAYLSGPMSGHDLYNFPAFFEAEEFLKDQGWKVVNPARLDTELGFVPSLDEAMPHEFYMKRDLPLLVKCDAIALLPEWWTSKGAHQELNVAMMCGLDVISATDGLPYPEYRQDLDGCGWAPTPPANTYWRIDGEYKDEFVTWAEARRMAGLGPESPLFEAHRIVHAERGASYGPPKQDFARTGRMWGAILGIPDVSPRMVALCLIGLKVSREAYQHKRDSLVDVAGYVETLSMIEGES